MRRLQALDHVRVVNRQRIEYGWEGIIVRRREDGSLYVRWPITDRRDIDNGLFSDDELQWRGDYERTGNP